LIDRIIPMMQAFQRLSTSEQEAARQFEQNEQKSREAEEVAEKMAEAMPAFINPVSFSLQGCRTSLLDKKMEQIQKVWNRLTVRGRRPNFQQGFQVASRPRLIN